MVVTWKSKKSLESVTIPDGVIEIGSNVFDKCNNLKIKCSRDSYATEYTEQNVNVTTK